MRRSWRRKCRQGVGEADPVGQAVVGADLMGRRVDLTVRRMVDLEDRGAVGVGRADGAGLRRSRGRCCRGGYRMT